MNYIEIANEEGKQQQMILLMTFELKEYDYHYIVYQELDHSKTYVAKYKEKLEDLITDISEDELILCQTIIDEVYQ